MYSFACWFHGDRKALDAVVHADGDDGVGDERAVAAVLIEHFQTTHHYVHSGAAVGERGSHLIGIHLFRVWRADGYVDKHIVSGGTHQPGEPETAMMYSIKDGTLGRQGIIQAVDIDPHAQSVTQRTSAMTSPPELAIALVAPTSFVDASAHTLGDLTTAALASQVARQLKGRRHWWLGGPDAGGAGRNVGEM